MPAVPAVPTRRTARRRGVLVGAFLVVAAFFLGAPAAYADVPIDQVASALLASPVYVEDGNEAGVTSADEASLLGEVQSAGTPLYVAVVKADSLGGLTIAEYTHSLGTKVGVQGTYAVVAGRQFYADSQTLQGVGAIATASVAQNSGKRRDRHPRLVRLGRHRAGGGPGTAAGSFPGATAGAAASCRSCSWAASWWPASSASAS